MASAAQHSISVTKAPQQRLSKLQHMSRKRAAGQNAAVCSSLPPNQSKQSACTPALSSAESDLQLFTPYRADDKQQHSPSTSVANSVATEHPFAKLAAKSACPAPLQPAAAAQQTQAAAWPEEQEVSYHLHLDLDMDSD